jgi:predicted transcriptional regulator
MEVDMPRRLELVLTPELERRLAALAAKMELKRTEIIRQAVKRMAEQEGVELAPEGRADG